MNSKKVNTRKLYKNILIYDIFYKTLIGTKPLCILFDKVDRSIRDYDGTKYLVLFDLEKYNAIYGRIRHLVGLKRGITHVFSYKYAKIKVDSDNDLPLEEILTLHNVIILLYYYNTFLEKCSYQVAKIQLQQIFLIV